MTTKILFCNVAWMENYSGITDDDRPINGGDWVKKNKDGGEVFNFHDYNGKCYGYVMTYGNMSLEKHYKNINKNNEYVDNVLVVWVATNKKNETRIVGWYKNARVYRTFQWQPMFTGNYKDDLYYNVFAEAEDCFLLPEDKRTFPIQRAAQAGIGMGMGQSNIWYADSEFAKANIVPKVIQYVENYKGVRINTVYKDEDVKELIDRIDDTISFDKLYEKGIKSFDEDKFDKALSYFLKAKRLEENTDLLYYIGKSYNLLCRFDKCIDIFNHIVEIEGSKRTSLDWLSVCHIRIGDLPTALEYGYKLLEILDDTEDDIDQKAWFCWLIFSIHMYKNEFVKAKEIINILTKIPSKFELDETITDLKNYLKEATVGIVY